MYTINCITNELKYFFRFKYKPRPPFLQSRLISLIKLDYLSELKRNFPFVLIAINNLLFEIEKYLPEVLIILIRFDPDQTKQADVQVQYPRQPAQVYNHKRDVRREKLAVSKVDKTSNKKPWRARSTKN